MKANTVYLGYDPRQDTAFQVARHSIASRTGPIKIIPLRLTHLTEILTRPIENRNGQLWCPISGAPMSTEFAISRFCVPFINLEGWALFADCDILCWSDIQELFDLADDKFAVMVVKHEWRKTMVGDVTVDGRMSLQKDQVALIKMDGQVQTMYARKNWSSVVLWNCDHPGNKRFTFENLNQWPGRDLHAFKWLNDDEIGELPQHWNWLINVTPGKPEAKGIWHYTLGTPTFAGYEHQPYSEQWLAEYERLRFTKV